MDVPEEAESSPATTASASVSDTAQALVTESQLLTLEDLLPDIGSNLSVSDHDDDEAKRKSKLWLNVNGTFVHKSSAIRYLFSTEEGRKSTDRGRRVAGMQKIRVYTNPLASQTSVDLGASSVLVDVLSLVRP